MPTHGVKSGITDAALKRFMAEAQEGNELSCKRIKGFGVGRIVTKAALPIAIDLPPDTILVRLLRLLKLAT